MKSSFVSLEGFMYLMALSDKLKASKAEVKFKHKI